MQGGHGLCEGMESDRVMESHETDSYSPTELQGLMSFTSRFHEHHEPKAFGWQHRGRLLNLAKYPNTSKAWWMLASGSFSTLHCKALGSQAVAGELHAKHVRYVQLRHNGVASVSQRNLKQQQKTKDLLHPSKSFNNNLCFMELETQLETKNKTNQHQPTSTNINQHQPTSTNINQPTNQFVYLYKILFKKKK